LVCFGSISIRRVGRVMVRILPKYHPRQLSWIIREFPGYTSNLPDFRTGHQISQIRRKALKVHFSHLFWPIFGIFGGNIFTCLFNSHSSLFHLFANDCLPNRTFWYALAAYRSGELVESWFVFCQNTIHANSPGLSRSFPDTHRISRTSVPVTKSPRYEGKRWKFIFHTYSGRFLAFSGEIFLEYLTQFCAESAELYF